MEYGTYVWRDVNGREREARIYFPNIDVFKGSLPDIADPLIIQQLISPTLQWQMLMFNLLETREKTVEEILRLDVSMHDLDPDHNYPPTSKPENFKADEREFTWSRFKLMSRDYMNASLKFLFLHNEPTR